jgi:ABC-2 type transport system ATP-binding protein
MTLPQTTPQAAPERPPQHAQERPPQPAPILKLAGVSRRYGRLLAVNNLDLEVAPGEIFGFVGPNGAGKTSTLRMIATLLQPSAGEIWVAGHPVSQDTRPVRAAIGYMPDFFGVYNDMRVWEYLDFFGACYHLPPDARARLTTDLLELVDLGHRREDMVDSLSRGMKQRLSLARTLVHDPQLLILDEPASGLDPRARVEIRALLVELARLGKTIFFSTHILADVAEICTRIGIIEAGKLAALGTLAELQRQLMPLRQIEIVLLGAAAHAEAALSLLRAHPAVTDLSQHVRDDQLFLEVAFNGDDAAVGDLLAALVGAGLPVRHFAEDRRDLESVFLRATKGLVT